MSAPLCLLGDSALLLRGALDERLRGALRPGARAVYVGAANDDDPAQHQLFAAAAARIGIAEAHVTAAAPDLGAIAAASWVFVAGGDPLRGLAVMRATGLGAAIVARHRAGALVMGSSAGAIVLGASVWDGRDPRSIVDGLGLVPSVIDAHAEPAWTSLRALCTATGRAGLGVRSRGGVWIDGEQDTSLGAGAERIEA